MKTEPITPRQKSKDVFASTGQITYPYTIHVSSYKKREIANCLAMKLKKKGMPAFVCLTEIPGKGDYHRVFIGFYSTLAETRKAASILKGQKDLYPLEFKMPYAIQIGDAGSAQELKKLETDLRSKAYMAYSISDADDMRKTRLLIGAFKTQNEAARLTRKLKDEGFKAEVVRR